MSISMSLIKADIVAASQAVDYYKQKNLKDIKNVAAYHLQQASEKLIKIQIYANAESINNASMFTHNIEKLLIYADTLEIDLTVPQYIRENSLIISDWEAGSRYSIDFSIKINTLKKTLSVISDWYDELYSAGLRQA